ncbi:MAG: class I SAM-dependent methyltransferase [Nitrospirae bacterium]|nr:class I SAM-dependent methyltransferase [Nitrospirota bacterium]
MEEIFPDIAKAESRVSLARPNAYNLSWEEVVTISSLVQMLSPKVLFEFGTFDGRTTLHLALNSPEAAMVYTIDKEKGRFDFGADTPFFKEVQVGECFLSTPVESKVKMLMGDSGEFDLAQFKRRVDFVFIDADHSYAGVMHDTEKAFDMIRPGGLVVWHDYLVIGDVTKAIVQICKGKALTSLKGTSLVVWQMPPVS